MIRTLRVLMSSVLLRAAATAILVSAITSISATTYTVNAHASRAQ